MPAPITRVPVSHEYVFSRTIMLIVGGGQSVSLLRSEFGNTSPQDPEQITNDMSLGTLGRKNEE